MEINEDTHDKENNITIRLQNGRLIKMSAEFLSDADSPKVSMIPQTKEDYIQCCQTIFPNILNR